MFSLVGYTGFVGSNLAQKHTFDGLYNSKNIQTAFHTNPDLLVYSGVRAEKFLANKDKKADFAVIENSIQNIKNINPHKMVLISTIDVYKIPKEVDETTPMDTDGLHPYGLNRYYLEKWVEENIKEHLIVRLPGLYGMHIKKNFIFDMIHIIPAMLNEQKYNELSLKSEMIRKHYLRQSNGFYKCVELSSEAKQLLKQEFLTIGFSALNFTDSRGVFQFYNLAFLWDHINIALKNGITKLNLATEPIQINDLYRYIYDAEFKNEIASQIPYYDFRTKYAKFFEGSNGYIFSKSFVMHDIKQFVEAYQ